MSQETDTPKAGLPEMTPAEAREWAAQWVADFDSLTGDPRATPAVRVTSKRSATALRLLLAEPGPTEHPDSVQLNAAICALGRVDMANQLDNSDRTLPEVIESLGETISTLAETLETYAAEATRVDALAWHLSKNATATFTVWANEMVEMQEMPADEDDETDEVPMLFDNIRDLLDELAKQQYQSSSPLSTERDNDK